MSGVRVRSGSRVGQERDPRPAPVRSPTRAPIDIDRQATASCALETMFSSVNIPILAIWAFLTVYGAPGTVPDRKDVPRLDVPPVNDTDNVPNVQLPATQSCQPLHVTGIGRVSSPDQVVEDNEEMAAHRIARAKSSLCTQHETYTSMVRSLESLLLFTAARSSLFKDRTVGAVHESIVKTRSAVEHVESMMRRMEITPADCTAYLHCCRPGVIHRQTV